MRRAQYRDEYDAFRRILIQERKERGLTQWDVAKSLGKDVTQSDVSKIERGERRLDVVEFVVFAHALGAEPQEMLILLEVMLNEDQPKRRRRKKV